MRTEAEIRKELESRKAERDLQASLEYTGCGNGDVYWHEEAWCQALEWVLNEKKKK
jgi:hypothetical protein